MCVCFYVILSLPDTFCFVVTSTWNKLLEIKLFLKVMTGVVAEDPSCSDMLGFSIAKYCFKIVVLEKDS